MRTNHVKQKLKNGEPTLGAWLSIPSAPVARIMSRLGFDWITIDIEHTATNPQIIGDMIAAIADAGTCAPFARLPNNSVEWFKWVLDAGAWGVIVPMVNTPEEARYAVNQSKYPPFGMRSIGGAYAPLGFGTSDWPGYIQIANEEILVAVQIESTLAVQNIDELLAVPGIDVAFVGPNDLHVQMGLPPSTEGAEPEFLQALEEVKEAARKHHVATGIYSSGGEAGAMRVSQGFQMVTVANDLACLRLAASQQLQQARDPR